jgi:hypothetical protein
LRFEGQRTGEGVHGVVDLVLDGALLLLEGGLELLDVGAARRRELGLNPCFEACFCLLKNEGVVREACALVQGFKKPHTSAMSSVRTSCHDA